MTDLIEFITLLGAGGAIPVLAAAWWLERQAKLDEREERRKLQHERDLLLERVLKAITDAVRSGEATVDAQSNTNLVLSSLKDLLMLLLHRSGSHPKGGHDAP